MHFVPLLLGANAQLYTNIELV